MTLTLLLDLDDTLLTTNQSVFVPAYFQAISTRLAPRLDPGLVAGALLSGMNAMNQSGDFSRTLKEIFDDVFYPMLGLQKGELDAEIEIFYDEIFPALQPITERNPDAKPFVEWAQSQGFRLAVATDPLLPRKATHQRVRWAGFDPGEFELISTFDDFHFSKTHSAYYAELLGRIGWQEGPVLMVGNDMERDILPARRLGLQTFFLNGDSAPGPGPEAGLRGSLPGLRRYLESADLTSLVPAFTTRESILSIHSATPAVLDGLFRNLDLTAWTRKPSDDDWSLTELICHLRDTEREIHHMQLKLFNGHGEPFIPRPDTGVWASQRDYLHEDGPSAMLEFYEARRITLDMLNHVPGNDWERKARHAIFGPTNFREVAGFMGDHDRMHIHQAWSILKKLALGK
jgi:FMN phosphatase YigB (HAD superfamily)